MSQRQSVLVNVDSSFIATITLNRPEVHNAFDDVMVEQLTDCLQTLANNTAIRAVILQAHGKNFSAGADLRWMQHMVNFSKEENVIDALKLAHMLNLLDQLNKPTLALVQGAVFGGGVGLVACCDVVIAAPSTQFCLSEVKLGLIPAVISPYVCRAIGERAARRYFLTAESFSAFQAQQWGLVHEIVAEDKFDHVLKEIILRLLQNSPYAIAEAKRLIHRVAGQPINEELKKLTACWIAELRTSVQGQEGLQAFLEKRKPVWSSGL